jgi:hypothetical protein
MEQAEIHIYITIQEVLVVLKVYQKVLEKECSLKTISEHIKNQNLEVLKNHHQWKV